MLITYGFEHEDREQDEELDQRWYQGEEGHNIPESLGVPAPRDEPNRVERARKVRNALKKIDGWKEDREASEHTEEVEEEASDADVPASAAYSACEQRDTAPDMAGRLAS